MGQRNDTRVHLSLRDQEICVLEALSKVVNHEKNQVISSEMPMIFKATRKDYSRGTVLKQLIKYFFDNPEIVNQILNIDYFQEYLKKEVDMLNGNPNLCTKK